MSSHRITTLFESDLLRIEDFHCCGRDGDGFAENHEIVFPRYGSYKRDDAGGSVIADVNQVLFFNPHQPYDITHPAGGEDRSTVFTVAPAALRDLLSVYDPPALDRVDGLFTFGHHWVSSGGRVQHYQLLRLLAGNAWESLAIEESVLTFLADVLQTDSKETEPHVQHRDVTEAVKLILSARFREKLTLDLLAAAVHYSPYTLCRIFKQQTGRTLYAYLIRLRLLHAMDALVENPHETILTIAAACGFYSHSQFTTAFQREFTVTPSLFRAMTRSEQSKILEA